MTRAVIVGAGPAGIAAAAELARAKVEIVLLDEARQPGGQAYRRPAEALDLDMRVLLGPGFPAFAAFHARAAALCRTIDYRPQTSVWSVNGGAVHLASAAGLDRLAYDVLILATGATDRVMPVAGWTLPGVFALGAAQALLKDQGCLIGRDVVFCGSSPLLHLAAWQHRQVGGRVVAVLDTAPFTRKIAAAPRLLADPATLASGLATLRKLRAHGVPILHGVTLERFEGADRVGHVLYRTAAGSLARMACDAVAYGHGLRPECQLAEVAGCTMRYDAVRRLHAPRTDIDGCAGEALYVVGDGGTIGGAAAASVSGRLAAWSALRALGLRRETGEERAARRTLVRLRRFQHGLAQAFPWPARAAATLGDDVILCRCEDVRVGELRSALAASESPPEANRAKAATRCGMGRCQGRFCGPALGELTAVDDVPGRLRAQPPVKPLPIALAAEAV